MFRGLTSLNMDVKGRIIIPSKYRHVIDQQADGALVVTIDTEDACLLLYPLPEWAIIEQRLAALPTFQPAARRIQRLLIGHAMELELDGHGRILLPPSLREYAGLNGAVVLLGQGNRFEIWGETQWELHRNGLLSEGMGDGGEAGLPPELTSLSL